MSPLGFKLQLVKERDWTARRRVDHLEPLVQPLPKNSHQNVIQNFYFVRLDVPDHTPMVQIGRNMPVKWRLEDFSDHFQHAYLSFYLVIFLLLSLVDQRRREKVSRQIFIFDQHFLNRLSNDFADRFEMLVRIFFFEAGGKEGARIDRRDRGARSVSGAFRNTRYVIHTFLVAENVTLDVFEVFKPVLHRDADQKCHSYQGTQPEFLHQIELDHDESPFGVHFESVDESRIPAPTRYPVFERESGPVFEPSVDNLRRLFATQPRILIGQIRVAQKKIVSRFALVDSVCLRGTNVCENKGVISQKPRVTFRNKKTRENDL